MAAPLDFVWIGGDSSLDFNNTVSWDADGLSQERFRSAEGVREWARGAGLPLPARTRPALLLAEAVALREALHRFFLPIALGSSPSARDAAAFRRFLRRAAAQARLEGDRRRGFRWTFSGGRGLDPALGEVVWSAARLLTSPDLGRLKVCANPECGWLFLDRSRRGNRRWCEMRECGNRAKARRYYRKHRAGKVRSAR